jgi:hypothetical protein
MNYTYQIVNPQDIVLGIDRLEIDYRINSDAGSGTIGCPIGYTLMISSDPSQPNRTTYVFRTCIITSGQIQCNNDSNASGNNIPVSSISSVTLKFISSLGNTIASITIEDSFDIAQNYCLVITFIVIDNVTTQDIEDITINRYSPEDIIDYVSRPTKLISNRRNNLIRSHHNRVSTTAVRYTNSISDVVSNCNFVPYLAVQDRYFVINYNDDVTSEYATVRLPDIRISGWTDRDIYFFEKVYADVSDPSVSITDDMGLLEPLIADPYHSTQPFTLVHNMYPLSINRNGEIVVYNNQPKDFPYVTSLFHTTNVSQIRYDNKIYKPLTPYMYYRTKVVVNKPTEVEILYSYLNRFSVVRTTLQSQKVLRTRIIGQASVINTDTVTRNILLPVDYNILFYLESHCMCPEHIGIRDEDEMPELPWTRYVRNYMGNNIVYPTILQNEGDWKCNLVIFKRNSNDVVSLAKDVDIDLRIMRWDSPISFFAGGGLLGWGRHKEHYNSKYYLFSWYKILHTKRLVSNTSNTPRHDDYLRYYYYYQYII